MDALSQLTPSAQSGYEVFAAFRHDNEAIRREERDGEGGKSLRST